MPKWEFILAVLAILVSITSSAWAIKAIIRHEMDQCDKRMEAFKEGLERGKDIRGRREE